MYNFIVWSKNEKISIYLNIEDGNYAFDFSDIRNLNSTGISIFQEGRKRVEILKFGFLLKYSG